MSTNSKLSFKKINIILVGFLTIAGVFFYILLFRKSSVLVVTLKVGENNIYYWHGTKPWFSNVLKEGMKELDGLGKVQAEVLDTYIFDMSPNSKSAYLTVKLKSLYNKASNTYSYKGMGVLVGSTLKLNLDDLYVEGLITSIDGQVDERRKVKLGLDVLVRNENSTYMETSGIEPFLAESIKVGDKTTDNKGNVMIEVLEKNMDVATRVNADNYGVTRISTNPLRRDVKLKLAVNAIEVDGRYYIYDDIPLLIGYEVPFNTKYLSIYPVITDIYELE